VQRHLKLDKTFCGEGFYLLKIIVDEFVELNVADRQMTNRNTWKNGVTLSCPDVSQLCVVSTSRT